MKIKEVPTVLFLEFSKLTNAEVQRIEKNGRSDDEFLIRSLNISEWYPGAIGLGKGPKSDEKILWENEPNEFILWDKVPKGKVDVLEPQPILTIIACHYDNCRWCGPVYRHHPPQEKRDDLHIILGEQYLSIFNPVAGILGQIIKRAHELAMECEEYWEDDPRVQP